ncbi:MAG TPA: efflux RND transporter periplasmic adaptor subunit [Candidatus Ozemobacteraceae bacterium]|nr:efflux RND transporter periplasmic adaptor subunit [Candidatus Ozemobacteraceae bacterium]
MNGEQAEQVRGLPDLADFVRIGLALSQERDLPALLEMILGAARSMADADAGTLYLLDPENQCLQFRIMQNDTTHTRLNAARDPHAQIPPPVPLYVDGAPNKANVSSFVALENRVVNIPDVYSAQGFNFSGVKTYDETSGYRSRSMLVIPLADHRQKVLGVLQLLNAKTSGSGGAGRFTEHHEQVVSALASQAALALSNHKLVGELERELTEVNRLRDSEQALGQELRRAAVTAEESNAELREALQAVRTVRFAGFIFLLLMAVIGGLAYQGSGPELFPDLMRYVTSRRGGVESASGSADVAVVSPEIRPVSANVTLVGQIEPGRQVPVASPFNGKIREVCCEYGQVVQAGDRLLVIDDAELVIALRDARAALIRAEQAYKSVRNWASGPDVIRARLSQERNRALLEAARRKLGEAREMFDQGMVARVEVEGAQDAYDSQLLIVRNGEDDLANLLERGNRDNLSIAEMEWKNARARVEELEAQQALGEVRAPVSGVVLRPSLSAEERRRAKPMEPGTEFNRGEVLAVIGDLESLSVRTQVDEVDIHKIVMGQEVLVTGDAFPGVALDGFVSYVSCQAQGSSGGRQEGSAPPSFDIVVTVEKLTEEQKQVLRVGMSATLTVTTYTNPRALVVPVTAVLSEMETQSVLRQNPETRRFERVPIQAGTTTIDSVEILGGLAASDVIALYAENLAP